MLLGFKRRFAPFVENGTKTHTIRAIRKRRPRVGEVCHCYVDPRQKSMRLLGRFPCVKVERISIYESESAISSYGVSVNIDGVSLDATEKDALAHRDGFRSGGFKEMLQFWKGRLPFEGEVIHWRYTKLIVGKKKRRRRGV